MNKLILAILLVAIIISVGATSQVARADSPVSGELSVVLIDRLAVGEADGGIDLTKSLVGLVSTLQEGHGFAFLHTDDPTDPLGPVLVENPDLATFQEQIAARLASWRSAADPDLVNAFAETYNFLGDERAAPGSTVYFLTGGARQADLQGLADRLAPIARLYKDSGWSIVGLSVPGASADVEEFLSTLATDSGGASFQLSTPDGFKDLADMILREQAKGSLNEIGSGVLSPSEVLTSTFSVAPGTSEVTLVFFKEGPYGSLRLSNPSGYEASAGDRTMSLVVETPVIVIWRLVDPRPGEWRVDLRGIDGTVSAWQYSSNMYSLALDSYAPVAINEPHTLIAHITDGKEKVVLDGVDMTAKITGPNGSTFLHPLNDDAQMGDSVARDGYFSGTMPPLLVEGDYRVQLELTWPESGHRVSSLVGFTAQPFPAIQVSPLGTEELHPGVRARVATLFVNVQGQPYAVPIRDLDYTLSSNVAEPGTLEIEPRRLLDEDSAWSYDVFFTPGEQGSHRLSFKLNSEYAGRNNSYVSDSMLVSSVIPAPPPEPAPVAPLAPLPVVTQQLPAAPSGLPMGLIAVPIVIVVALLGWVVYWLTRTRPFGYLYNDRDELVVDFAKLKRHPVMRLFYNDQVKGKELGVQALEGVSFKFAGDRVDLDSRRATPTVRVNNQPLIGRTSLLDRTWIGTHGKLFSFLLGPGPLRMEPGLGDDD